LNASRLFLLSHHLIKDLFKLRSRYQCRLGSYLFGRFKDSDHLKSYVFVFLSIKRLSEEGFDHCFSLNVTPFEILLDPKVRDARGIIKYQGFGKVE
jgi:hypothetical protein